MADLRFKVLRRVLIRLAYKGCGSEDAQALIYAKEVMYGKSLEDRIRLEGALVLDYWTKAIFSELATPSRHNIDAEGV